MNAEPLKTPEAGQPFKELAPYPTRTYKVPRWKVQRGMSEVEAAARSDRCAMGDPATDRVPCVAGRLLCQPRSLLQLIGKLS
jgi:hypothetical protein